MIVETLVGSFTVASRDVVVVNERLVVALVVV